METSRVTTQVEVIQILANEPPTLMVRKRTVGVGGVVRHFTLRFPVLDPPLFQRLLAQVCVGMEIRATIVNEWHETGRITYLEDFQFPDDILEVQPAKELVSQAA